MKIFMVVSPDGERFEITAAATRNNAIKQYFKRVNPNAKHTPEKWRALRAKGFSCVPYVINEMARA